MNRRDFLKAAMVGAGGLIIARPGLVFAQEAGETGQEFIHPTLASTSRDPVGARLICHVDISGSVDTAEYDIQMKAMANAIESEDFQHAVSYIGGPQSIAICVADFGSTAGLGIPWVDFRDGDKEKFKAFAEEIRKMPRRESGSTNHVAALDFATVCFDNCPWDGKRNIVDILTDGKHNMSGSPAAFVERLARDYDATVNTLITLDSNQEDLESWCRENLITKPGFFKSDGTVLDPGFVKVVATQKMEDQHGAVVEYHKAMDLAFRRKLIMEVAGLELEELHEIVRTQQAAGGFTRGILNSRTGPAAPTL